MHNRLLCADEGLECSLNEMLSGLGENLDDNVVRDLVLFNYLSDEIEVGLRG